MADISSIKLPSGNTYDVKDILGRQSIPYGIVTSDSTTVFTATVDGVTQLSNGVCCLIRNNNKQTSASGWTLNVNGLGAKPVYNNMADASRETTIFNKVYTMLFVYDEDRVDGGCWICYKGYDSNTNTIGYQLRTNSTVMNVSDTARYYKLYFMSADNTKWVPASVNSTNSATSAKTVNQRPINPFGRIVYTSANTNYTAGSNLAATTIWDQYTLALGYSFNRTGAALTMTVEAPVYVKCAPQADGSAIMDADTPIVQALPSTADGKIYIYLGVAYSAVNIELVPHHPVYYHDGTAIRLWTGASGGSSSVAWNDITGKPTFATVATSGSYNDLSNKPTIPSAVTESTVAGWGFTKNTGTYSKPSGGIPKTDLAGAVQTSLGKADTALQSFTESDPTVPAWAKQASKPTYTASEVGALPDSTVIPSKTSDLTNDSGFITGYTETDPIFTGSAAYGISSSDITNWNGKTSNTGTVTSVRVQATSPVTSSVNTAQSSTLNTTIALADGYGDTKNPYASKTKNYVLAAPSNVNGAPSFRALVADDIPSLTKSKISDFPTIPTKTSDLTNDSGFLTSFTETDPTVPSWAKASSKPSYTKSEVGLGNVDNVKQYSASNPPPYPVTSVNGSTGAVTVSVPTKVSDLTNDSGFITGMTILSYGNSTWADFEAAYNANKVVYCRASSNANPASGSQTRLAFMAYVNNATTPTNVEFQYYRSMSTHTASQQGDQVFVYKLDKTSGWSVITREASVKVVAGDGLGGTYSNGTMTLTGPTKISDLTNDSGFITSESDPVFTASAAHGITSTNITNWNNKISEPASEGTNGQVLMTNGSGTRTWGSVSTADEKIKLTSQSTSGSYPLIFGPTSITSNSTYQGYYNTGITINPSTKAVTATTFVGALTGTASGNLTSSSTLSASKLSGAIPSAVTATTQTSTDNSTKIATTAFVKTAIANVGDNNFSTGSYTDINGNTVTALYQILT